MYLTHFGFTDTPFRELVYHNLKQRCFINYFAGVELMLAHACNESGAVGLFGQDEEVIAELLSRLRRQNDKQSCLINVSDSLQAREFEKRISEFLLNVIKHEGQQHQARLLILQVQGEFAPLHKRILRKVVDKAREQGRDITLLIAGAPALAPALHAMTVALPLRAQISLRPLSWRETRDWFTHQQRWNGVKTAPFSWLHILMLYSRCQGKLSLMAQAAHYALLAAFAERSRQVKSRHVRYALNELTARRPRYALPLLAGGIWLGLFIAAGWQALPHTSELLPLPAAWAHKPPPAQAKPLVRIEDSLDQPISAMRQLYRVWGYDVPLEEAFCEEAGRARLQCKKGEGPVSTLEKNGYPWVAEIKVAGRIGYASVVRSGPKDLDLLMGNKTWQVSRDWFKNAATGNYVLLYRLTPQGNSKVDAKSDASEIAWLNKMLSRALMKPKNSAPGWSGALVENVKEFQRKSGLKADGQAGESTLMKLLVASGESPGLIREKEAVQEPVQKVQNREPAEPAGTALASTLPVQKASVAMTTKP
ncbi:ExeA family protein [Franconibacter helveticus]|uniref:ExeA family protein n=1 Tax=Franconibacter helveticus TaxID=357240 RepID=UPI000DA1E92D|nr:peptidoglycan-binding domain-containing protein [Franconibacter helveticus]